MGTFLQDVKYGIRILAKKPGFTVIAILTLALGIGANAAIFSVANAFLSRPIWFPQLDRLVMVMQVPPGDTQGWNSISPADYIDWKAQSRSFEHMGAFEWDDLNLTGNGDPQKVTGAMVSANFFEVLQMKPELGRAFLADEEQLGHNQEAILGH